MNYDLYELFHAIYFEGLCSMYPQFRQPLLDSLILHGVFMAAAEDTVPLPKH